MGRKTWKQFETLNKIKQVMNIIMLTIVKFWTVQPRKQNLDWDSEMGFRQNDLFKYIGFRYNLCCLVSTDIRFEALHGGNRYRLGLR